MGEDSLRERHLPGSMIDDGVHTRRKIIDALVCCSGERRVDYDMNTRVENRRVEHISIRAASESLSNCSVSKRISLLGQVSLWAVDLEQRFSITLVICSRAPEARAVLGKVIEGAIES